MQYLYIMGSKLDVWKVLSMYTAYVSHCWLYILNIMCLVIDKNGVWVVYGPQCHWILVTQGKGMLAAFKVQWAFVTTNMGFIQLDFVCPIYNFTEIKRK